MIKKRIKKWLGIDEQLKEIFTPYIVTEEDLKSKIEDAISEAFTPTPNESIENTYLWHRKNIRGSLDKAVKKLAEEYVESLVKKRLDELVVPEDFIDGVVERIKKKQLD